MSALNRQEAPQPLELQQDSIAEAAPAVTAGREPTATFTRNSLFSLARLFTSSAIALLLPGYLTHRLPMKTYAAWVLILQLGAYVSYLDFGIQQGISKFVAEYEARGDMAGASMRASAGLVLMTITSALGVCLTLVLGWQVPGLFRDMPAALYPDVRISVILVGVSLSFTLLCSIFSSVFFGLQRYAVPTALSLLNRILFTIGVLISAALHQSLVVMAALTATINFFTGSLQFWAWRRMASEIRLSVRQLQTSVLWQMLQYCSYLAIWTAGILCVSGLDLTIVGKYDFGQTAYYSVAILPTNFVISVLSAALAPLIPTASALSVERSPEHIGELLTRLTRYSSTVSILSALPLLVAGYPLLKAWVGPSYAVHTIGYLRILILSNVLRNLCVPYASMLLATNSQRAAILGAIVEAVVNLGCSIYLASRLGAIGVAYGTFAGSFVSLAMHFAVSMPLARSRIDVSRSRLLFEGMLRPCIVAVPSLVILPRWQMTSAPDISIGVWLLWGFATLMLTWFVALNSRERSSLPGIFYRRLKLAP